jgi:hypothetical protein
MASNSQGGSRKTVVVIVLSVLALAIAGYSASRYFGNDYSPKTASIPDPDSTKLKLPDTPPPGLGGAKPDRGHSTLGN